MEPNPVHTLSRKVSNDKVVSAATAVAAIQNHETIATGGFVGIGFASS